MFTNLKQNLLARSIISERNFLVRMLAYVAALFIAVSSFQNLNTVDAQLGQAISAVSYPALKPLAGLGDPTLAYGVAGLSSDWSVAFPYLDIMKMSRQMWGFSTGWADESHESLKSKGYFDENGYPKLIPSNLKGYRATWAWGEKQFDAQQGAIGRYVLTYQGEGQIRLGGIGTISTESGKIVFDIKAGVGNWWLDIIETDPNKTGNYIRDIRIIREDRLDLYNSGQIFNPEYLDLLKDVRQLRFMGSMNVNDSKVKTFSEYPVSASTITWSGPVPLEIMVRLANEVGADPWFNMPFLADDDFSRQFATYVKANLDPKLVAHVELSNEVWNWSFAQAGQSHQAGIKAWNLDPNNGGAAWTNWYGKRVYEVMKVWTDVYGAEAPTRLKRIAATQTVWPENVTVGALEAPMWKQYDPKNYVPPHTILDALAPTTYFTGDLVTNKETQDKFLPLIADPNQNARALYNAYVNKPWPASGAISVSKGDFRVTGIGTKFTTELKKGGVMVIGGNDYWVNAIDSDTSLRLNRSLVSESVTNVPIVYYHGGGVYGTGVHLKNQKVYADKYGLDLLAYEGGQHDHHAAFVNIAPDKLAAMQDFLISYVRSQEMSENYQQLWDMWKKIGSGPFMQFTEIGSPSKWGSWGVRASLSDNPPRALLLDKLNAETTAWWETRGGDHFKQGVTTFGTNVANTLSGTNAEDYLIGLAGDDTLYAGPGNDGINGGVGTDTALFKGNRSAYTITPEGKGYRVKGPDGSDYIFDIERLTFEDGTTISPAGAVISNPVIPPVIPPAATSTATTTATSTATTTQPISATSTDWQTIAQENRTFTVSGTQIVRYGKGTTWIEKLVTNTGTCSNSFFGRDPLRGVVKECQVRQSNPKAIAIENQTFTVSGTQIVRYGRGTTWIEKSVTNTGTCSNSFFGRDPLRGVVKECEIVRSATTSTATTTNTGSVTVTGITDGQTVSGVIKVEAVPAGLGTISVVTFAINGKLISTEKSIPYALGGDDGVNRLRGYNTTVLSNGNHTLTIVATGAAGSVTRTMTFTVVNQTVATSSDPVSTPAATTTTPDATSTNWQAIASEGQTFTVSGTQTVRYGKGTTWIEKSVTDNGTCSNSFFGRDPLVGTVKECQVRK